MIYGYARVSTKGQQKDGNSLEAQEKILRENGATIVFKDSFTGTKKHRPELDKLMNLLQEGDTLIVTKLDRIARSAVHGAELVEELLKRGVKLNILNMGIMDNTPASKLIRNIFFAFAEFERDMIVERTTEGKEIARQRKDYREGRPPVVVDINKFMKYLKKQKAGKITVNEAIKELKISRATWYNLVKDIA
jgi:DNA invertase Pin-like site-specific DNA recombinase